MPRVTFTGLGKTYWVPDPTGAGTVVTLAAPTATQVNTGTNVTPFLRRDGLTVPQSGNVVDVADASSRFNKTGLGTYGGDALELKLYRDSTSASDTAWPLFAQGLYGFLIVFRFGTAGALPAALDKCEVYQCGVISREMAQIGENDPQMFTVNLAILNLNDAGTALV